MSEINWYFEVIFYNQTRMKIDVEDSVVTQLRSYYSCSETHAIKLAWLDITKDPLTHKGWSCKVSACDLQHAMKIATICSHGFD